MPRLLVTKKAERQIRQAADWWFDHRHSSRSLLRSELQRAFRLILDFPESGAKARNVELQGVRRVLLVRCQYFLYYQAREDVVEVLAFWHTSRGRGPDL